MRVRYFCHWGKLTGYGRAARDYCAALARAGVELDIVPYESLAATAGVGDRAISPEPRYAWLDHLVRTPDELVPADVEVHHTLPRLLEAVTSEGWPAARGAWGASPRRVAVTTWETDTFPAEYAQVLRAFHATIVPSTFCRDAISPDADRRAPFVVPHCFDPHFWNLDELAAVAGGEPGPCRFYTIGAWSERKNPLGVLRAYLHAFTSDDNVQLLMLLSNPDFDAIRSTIARSGLPANLLPEIHVPDRVFSEQELLELHAGADCFVSATRAEGWGLGHFEAAIMGKWILTPTWGGHADFLRRGFEGPEHLGMAGDPEYPRLLSVRAYRTPCFGAEVKGPVIERDGKRMQQSTIAMPPGVTCKHQWAEPDIGTMAYRMRELYEERRDDRLDAYDEEMLAARASLEARYSYDTVGRQMADLLQEIAR
jgi:glycosyltransferase involved in cell wall biosynthesis